MNEQDTSQIEGLKEEVSAISPPPIASLPFDLFNKINNKTTRLLATAPNQQAVDGKHRWYEFTFREPSFVTTVNISVTGYGGYLDFDIRWYNDSGIARRVDASPKDGLITFEVADLCTKIAFRPPAVWFTSTTIHDVQVNGIERADIAIALDALSDFESYRARMLTVVDKAIARADERLNLATQATTQRGAIQREIETAKNSLARIKKQLDQTNLTKSELIAQNTATESAIADANARLQKTQQDNGRLIKEVGRLDQEVLDKSASLRNLQSQIGLFPTEIVDFVKQGNRSIALYALLAFIPIAIILVMFYELVNGAANLTTILTEDPNINVTAALLSRAPYVFIATAVVTACYGISRTFIHQLIKINDQRLALSKISIVAKDVSAAAEHELDLTLEDAFRLRTELKMKLLSEHLKSYLSEDFSIPLPRRLLAQLASARQPDAQDTD